MLRRRHTSRSRRGTMRANNRTKLRHMVAFCDVNHAWARLSKPKVDAPRQVVDMDDGLTGEYRGERCSFVFRHNNKVVATGDDHYLTVVTKGGFVTHARVGQGNVPIPVRDILHRHIRAA